MSKKMVKGAVVALGLFSASAYAAVPSSGTVCSSSGSCGTNIDNIGFQVSIINGVQVANLLASYTGGESAVFQVTVEALAAFLEQAGGAGATAAVQELLDKAEKKS